MGKQSVYKMNLRTDAYDGKLTTPWMPYRRALKLISVYIVDSMLVLTWYH